MSRAGNTYAGGAEKRRSDGRRRRKGGEKEKENGNEELTNSAPHPCPYIHPYVLISGESQPQTAFRVPCYAWTGEYPDYNTQLAEEHAQPWEYRTGAGLEGTLAAYSEDMVPRAPFTETNLQLPILETSQPPFLLPVPLSGISPQFTRSPSPGREPVSHILEHRHIRSSKSPTPNLILISSLRTSRHRPETPRPNSIGTRTTPRPTHPVIPVPLPHHARRGFRIASAVAPPLKAATRSHNTRVASALRRAFSERAFGAAEER
jgi:hypothetical protein